MPFRKLLPAIITALFITFVPVGNAYALSYVNDVLQSNPASYFHLQDITSPSYQSVDHGSNSKPAKAAGSAISGLPAYMGIYSPPFPGSPNQMRGGYASVPPGSYLYSGAGSTLPLLSHSPNTTVEAWVWIDKNSSYTRTILSRQYSTNKTWSLALDASSQPVLSFYTPSSNAISFTAPISLTPVSWANKGNFGWNHIVGIFEHSALTNQTEMRMYVNGTQYTAFTPIGQEMRSAHQTSRLYMGYSNPALPAGAGGIWLDEVAVYDHVLSQAEILRHYVSGTTGVIYDYADTTSRSGDITTLQTPIVAPTDVYGGATFSIAPTYSLPSGLSISPTTGAIYGTTPVVGDGVNSVTYPIHVRATKNSQITDQTFNLTIVPLDKTQQYRPILRFDTDEQWRPLDIDKFLEESVHHLCVRTGEAEETDDDTCISSSISQASDLNNPIQNYPVNGDYYIDIDGDDDDGDDYAGRTECDNRNGSSPKIHDCNSGQYSKIYVNKKLSAETGQPYDYYNYWFFYRYNKFTSDIGTPATGQFNHEGDWEFVTIAAEPNSNTFHHATFSAHEGPDNNNINHGNPGWRYLREVLTCDNNVFCGGDDAPSGSRVNVFVANGTHANYPKPCAREFPDYCLQTSVENTSDIPEKDFDGAYSWGNNNITSALSPIGMWSTWPGDWGIEGNVTNLSGRNYFNSPWIDTCTNRWKTNEDCNVDFVQRNSSLSSQCSSWFGPFITSMQCSENSNGEPTVVQTTKPLKTGDKIEVYEGSSIALRVEDTKNKEINEFVFDESQEVQTIEIISSEESITARGENSDENNISPSNIKTIQSDS